MTRSRWTATSGTRAGWRTAATVIGGLAVVGVMGAPATPAVAQTDIAGQVDRALGLLDAGRVNDAVRILAPLSDQSVAGDRDVRALCGFAQATARSGDRRGAVRLFDNCITAASDASLTGMALAARNDLGVLQNALGDHADARDTWRRVLSAATAAGDRDMAAAAAVNLAWNAVDHPTLPLPERLAALGAAERPVVEVERDRLAVDHLLALTMARLELLDRFAGNLSPSDTQALATRSQTDLMDLRTRSRALSMPDREAQALGGLGRLYELGNRLDDALVLTDRALVLSALSGRTDLDYLWHWQRGRILGAAGDDAGALDAYRQAARSLSRIRQDVTAHFFSIGQRVARAYGPVFTGAADILLRRARRQSDAQATLREARQILEEFKTVELQEYYQDRCVLEREANVVAADGFDPGTAILYPVLLDDRLDMIVTFPDGRLALYSTPVGRETVEDTALSLRRLLVKVATNQYRRPAETLYDWLIAPIDADLQAAGVDTLVVAADGVLRTVPLSVLRDGDTILAERYAVGVIPNLTLTGGNRLSAEESQVLILGLSDAVQGFSALPHVDDEIREIAESFQSRILRNAEFSADGVERAFQGSPSFSAVHIASHGVFEASVSDSFILTHSGQISLDELEALLSTRNIARGSIDLLTLSACQTAAGDDRAALGLAGVAVKAGTASALATLWVVNDEATAQLTGDVYRRLAGGTVSKAHAVRAAQMALRDAVRYEHPYFWGAFLVIGDWR